MTRRWRATTSAATKISTCSTVRKLRKWRARYASVLNGRRLRFFSVDELFKNRRVASLKLRCVVLQQTYKAEYEDIKTRCFFPQTITPEYEAGKKLQGCSDVSSTSLLVLLLLLCVFVCVHLVSDCWTYPKNVSFLLVFFAENLPAASRHGEIHTSDGFPGHGSSCHQRQTTQWRTCCMVRRVQ